MTLTLTLPEELSESLTRQAHRLGLTPDGYVLRVLQDSIPASVRRERLMALLEARIADAELPQDRDDDPDSLLRAIDDDRLSDRPLFPPELKGITW